MMREREFKKKSLNKTTKNGEKIKIMNMLKKNVKNKKKMHIKERKKEREIFFFLTNYFGAFSLFIGTLFLYTLFFILCFFSFIIFLI